MSEVQIQKQGATQEAVGPAATPVATPDGRPYVRDANSPDGELAIWVPEKKRQGDKAYCLGIAIGTLRGQNNPPAGWWVELVEPQSLPPGLCTAIVNGGYMKNLYFVRNEGRICLTCSA